MPDPFAILTRHVDPSSEVFQVLAVHSVLVTRKALALARAYRERRPDAEVDLVFLEEAALLHDIGIVLCDAPEIGCHGSEPYVRHGVIGREVLEREGLPRHALVCERHTGAGITRDEVLAAKLPLPERDYLPVSLEEKLVCVADKFYSKSLGKLWRELPAERIGPKLAKYGDAVLKRWEELAREFL